MKYSESLKKYHDFQKVYRSGKSYGNKYLVMYVMENQKDVNSKLIELLSSIDKSKIEQVSKMVQNMSSEDLSNLVGMLNSNIKKK